mgnify:CR=1 FL=1
MKLSREGTDEEFKFKQGCEVTYSVDNKDYSVMRRIVIVDGRKIYQLYACDEKNPNQTIQVQDEDTLTETDCHAVLEKIWPTLAFDGDFYKFHNNIINNILGRICDYNDHRDHKIETYLENDIFCLKFNGVVFSKSKN